MNHTDVPLSPGLCAQLACVWEATARKPGNVHRLHDFADTTYVDFLVSAAAIAPVFEAAPRRGVGETVLRAVRATRRVTSTNTNLGIVLLLAPLAAVGRDRELRAGLADVLAGLTVADARAVFAAIRLASAGGLGEVPDQDVRGEPTLPLREVMALAADRDLIARQYVNGFAQIFEEGLPELLRCLQAGLSLEQAVIGCQLRLLAAHPDSLIRRKRGEGEAGEASRQARAVLAAGWPGDTATGPLRALEDWLRGCGHQRNPGTTADLVTACLFAALRQGQIRSPVRFAAPLRLVAAGGDLG